MHACNGGWSGDPWMVVWSRGGCLPTCLPPERFCFHSLCGRLVHEAAGCPPHPLLLAAPRARAPWTAGPSRGRLWRICRPPAGILWRGVVAARLIPAAGRSLSEACKYIGRMTPRLSQQGETMHFQNSDSFPFLCRSFWRALVQCRCGANLSSSSSRRLPQGSLASLGSRPTSPAPICPTITMTASPAMAELNISQVMARCIGRMAAAAAAAARTASRHAPEQRPAFSDHHPTSPRGRHKWQNAALTSGSRFEEANMRNTISLYLSDDLPSSSGHAFNFICVLIPLG